VWLKSYKRLLCKWEAQSSNPSPKERERERERESAKYRWLTPVIPATQEAEIRRIEV
jgi:hypothetical protein